MGYPAQQSVYGVAKWESFLLVVAILWAGCAERTVVTKETIESRVAHELPSTSSPGDFGCSESNLVADLECFLVQSSFHSIRYGSVFICKLLHSRKYKRKSQCMESPPPTT